MRQSDLKDFGAFEEIECPKGCGGYESLISHWKQAHDEPFPGGVARETGKVSERRAEVHEGRTLSEERRRKLSEANKGKTLSEETRRKMSKVRKGKTLPEEFKEKMWASPMEGTINTEESAQKISEAKTGQPLSDGHLRSIAQACQKNGGICSIPTRNVVRNKWELEIDHLLHDSGYDFQYEPGPFDIGGRTYLPDFRVGGDVIEVKGFDWNDDDRRAESFMEHHPRFRYIVVGTELPADVWVPWEERRRLPEIIDDKRNNRV